MAKWILGAFVLLWLVGWIHLPILETPLFSIFGKPFTLQLLLMLLALGYVIRFLPGILQTVVCIIIGIWLLSTFIFPAFDGIIYILMLIFVLYLIFSIV